MLRNLVRYHFIKYIQRFLDLNFCAKRIIFIAQEMSVHFPLESREMGLLSDRRQTNFYFSAYKEIAFVFTSLHISLLYSFRWTNPVFFFFVFYTRPNAFTDELRSFYIHELSRRVYIDNSLLEQP
jgi:hypothetical protein